MCTDLQNPFVVHDQEKITQNSQKHKDIFHELCRKLSVEVEVHPARDFDFSKEFLPFCDACTSNAYKFWKLVEEHREIELSISVIVEKFRMAVQQSVKKKMKKKKIVALSPRFDRIRNQVLSENNPVRYMSTKRIETVTGVPRRIDWDQCSQGSNCSVNSLDRLSPLLGVEDELYLQERMSSGGSSCPGSVSERSVDLDDDIDNFHNPVSVISGSGSGSASSDQNQAKDDNTKIGRFGFPIASEASSSTSSSSSSVRSFGAIEFELDLQLENQSTGREGQENFPIKSVQAKAAAMSIPSQLSTSMLPNLLNLDVPNQVPAPVPVDQNQTFINELLQDSSATNPTWSETDLEGLRMFGFVKVEVPSGNSNLWKCLYDQCQFSFQAGSKKKPRASMEYHIKTRHYRRNEFKCPACYKGFAIDVDLNKHLEERTCSSKRKDPNDTSKKCSKCQIIFPNMSKLKLHECVAANVESETADTDDDCDEDIPPPPTKKRKQNFVCNICNQSLASKASLERHQQQIHKHADKSTNEFTCERCGKIYSSKGSLMEHLRLVHQQGTPVTFVKCTFSNCDREFSNNHRLNRHLKTHKRKNS